MIGYFNGFEIIEIIGFDKNAQPFNVISVVVATENIEKKPSEFLSERLRVGGLNGLSFGIRKSFVTITSFENAIQSWDVSSKWKPVDHESQVGDLHPLDQRFVPANSLNQIALNRLTKNNFFNGCYLLELFDMTKKHVRRISTSQEALASLSEQVASVIPIELGSISDRLGNVVIQFPMDVLRAEFGTNGVLHNVEVAWHPEAKPRELLAVGSVYHDKTPLSFGCAELSDGHIDICPDPDVGVLHGYVWDKENELLLAATDELAFIRRMSMDMQPQMHEPRVFPVSLSPDAEKVRVRLSGSSLPSQIGDFDTERITEPIQNRIYDEERRELARQRTFVQYRPNGKTDIAERKRALNDLRALISRHGAEGIWLWDPYLSAQDILDTLFWNNRSGSPMRALTLLKDSERGSTKEDRRAEFACNLSRLDSNYLGLDVEFRSAHGQSGWDFHDRFLIFPTSGAGRTKAWSLGTSVNMLGKTHHILQQVDNAQLVANAFQELWDAVSLPDNLVWKCP